MPTRASRPFSLSAIQGRYKADTRSIHRCVLFRLRRPARVPQVPHVRGRSVGGSMSTVLKPSEFLARARAGHCGTTSDDGDCTIGESGSFDRVTKLMRHTKMRDERCKDERNNPWHTLTCSKRLDPTPQMMKQAMRSCLSACDSCARCNYVSFSWHFEDCACPMALNRARAI